MPDLHCSRILIYGQRELSNITVLRVSPDQGRTWYESQMHGERDWLYRITNGNLTFFKRTVHGFITGNLSLVQTKFLITVLAF